MDWRYGVFRSSLDYTLMAKDYMILILFLFLNYYYGLAIPFLVMMSCIGIGRVP